MKAGITGGSGVTSSGVVSATATDNVGIDAFAGVYNGAGEIGQGGGVAVTLGASVGINSIADTTEAIIDGSTVSGSSIALTATSASTILVDTSAVSGSVSGNIDGGSLSLTGAGSGSGNTVNNLVEAGVLGASHVTSGGAVAATATDNATIKAFAGGNALAIRAGGGVSAAAGVGVAAAFNDVGTQVIATIDPSVVSAGGAVSLTATSNAEIDAFTLGIAVAGGVSGLASIDLAGAGSVSINNIHTSVQATITGGSTVSQSTSVTLSATDNATIDAAAGSAALSIAAGGVAGVGNSLAASLAKNTVADNVRASIDGSTVNSTGAIGLTAQSTATIKSVTIAGSGTVSGGAVGIAVSGAGAGSSNTVTDSVQAAHHRRQPRNIDRQRREPVRHRHGRHHRRRWRRLAGSVFRRGRRGCLDWRRRRVQHHHRHGPCLDRQFQCQRHNRHRDGDRQRDDQGRQLRRRRQLGRRRGGRVALRRLALARATLWTTPWTPRSATAAPSLRPAARCT